jgi:hypothetical protein
MPRSIRPLLLPVPAGLPMTTACCTSLRYGVNHLVRENCNVVAITLFQVLPKAAVDELARFRKTAINIHPVLPFMCALDASTTLFYHVRCVVQYRPAGSDSSSVCHRQHRADDGSASNSTIR